MGILKGMILKGLEKIYVFIIRDEEKFVVICVSIFGRLGSRGSQMAILH